MLGKRAIQRAMAAGKIKVSPCDPDQVMQASIDLHLHGLVFTPKDASGFFNAHEDNRTLFKRVKVTNEDGYDGILFKKGRLYIGAGVERITLADDIAGELTGKSSLARLGLTVHLTAGFFEGGFDGPPTLEIVALHDIFVPCGWPIAQMRFIRVESASESYKLRGSYAGAAAITGPMLSRSYKHKSRHYPGHPRLITPLFACTSRRCVRLLDSSGGLENLSCSWRPTLRVLLVHGGAHDSSNRVRFPGRGLRSILGANVGVVT